MIDPADDRDAAASPQLEDTDATPQGDSPRVGDAATRLRPRDWLILGLVIGLTVGLGLGWLLQRPSSTQAASSGTDVTVTTRTTITTTVSGRADDGAEPGGATDGSGADLPDADVPQNGVAESVIGPTPIPEPAAGEQGGPIGPLGDWSRRIPDDPLARGAVDAPVVMVIFSDYRCPFCAKFSTDLEPQIVDRYVDAGELRLEWRDFPIFGDDSYRAAVAGRAAGQQGYFWEFNQVLYAAAPGSGHPDMPVDTLVGFAERAGVPDLGAFTAALDDPELLAAVQQDFDEGSRLGVPATPSFIINGYPLRGAQPIDEFFDLIDTVASLQ